MLLPDLSGRCDLNWPFEGFEVRHTTREHPKPRMQCSESPAKVQTGDSLSLVGKHYDGLLGLNDGRTGSVQQLDAAGDYGPEFPGA